MQRKLGAVIYLRSVKPLDVANFISDFGKRWPRAAFEGEGSKGNCSYFGIGSSHVALELRPKRVPDSVTDSMANTTLHWPTAKRDLAPHAAHIGVSTSIDGGDALIAASDLTKAIVSLLNVSDSLGVAWLNGEVLFPTKEFSATANELLALDEYPLMLWVAAQWIPKGRLVYTKGMSQFEAPELFLAEQPGPTKEVLTYLFDLVRYVLTSGKFLLEGETIDGPSGILRIEPMKSSTPEKKGLFLVPVRPN